MPEIVVVEDSTLIEVTDGARGPAGAATLASSVAAVLTATGNTTILTAAAADTCATAFVLRITSIASYTGVTPPIIQFRRGSDSSAFHLALTLPTGWNATGLAYRVECGGVFPSLAVGQTVVLNVSQAASAATFAIEVDVEGYSAE